MVTIELNWMVGSLFVVCVLSSTVTGSSLQWVVQHGMLHNQYNVIVTVAAVSSLIQTICCYINVLMYPNPNMGFVIFILLNWVVMTHSSVLLVSRKLSLTYLHPEQVWRRLLMINVFMFPISVFTCVYWTTYQNFDSPIFTQINAIMEPTQITMWGVIEFCLSGAFIVQMWKFSWTEVERKGIYVLIAVSICDCASVLTNVFIGDLPSTCVKGFVYALRIRLEVSVLDQMVEFVKAKRGSVTFGGPTSSRGRGLATPSSEATSRWFSAPQSPTSRLASEQNRSDELTVTPFESAVSRQRSCTKTEPTTGSEEDGRSVVVVDAGDLEQGLSGSASSRDATDLPAGAITEEVDVDLVDMRHFTITWGPVHDVVQQQELNGGAVAADSALLAAVKDLDEEDQPHIDLETATASNLSGAVAA